MACFHTFPSLIERLYSIRPLWLNNSPAMREIIWCCSWSFCSSVYLTGPPWCQHPQACGSEGPRHHPPYLCEGANADWHQSRGQFGPHRPWTAWAHHWRQADRVRGLCSKGIVEHMTASDVVPSATEMLSGYFFLLSVQCKVVSWFHFSFFFMN